VTISSKNWHTAKLVKDATKKNLLSDGIKKLMKPLNRCVEVRGDYVER
jgi:hypothetical protein